MGEVWPTVHGSDFTLLFTCQPRAKKSHIGQMWRAGWTHEGVHMSTSILPEHTPNVNTPSAIAEQSPFARLEAAGLAFTLCINWQDHSRDTVSYTHLTLPTSDLV